jgi:hypothetical protein
MRLHFSFLKKLKRKFSFFLHLRQQYFFTKRLSNSVKLQNRLITSVFRPKTDFNINSSHRELKPIAASNNLFFNNLFINKFCETIDLDFLNKTIFFLDLKYNENKQFFKYTTNFVFEKLKSLIFNLNGTISLLELSKKLFFYKIAPWYNSYIAEYNLVFYFKKKKKHLRSFVFQFFFTRYLYKLLTKKFELPDHYKNLLIFPTKTSKIIFFFV